MLIAFVIFLAPISGPTKVADAISLPKEKCAEQRLEGACTRWFMIQGEWQESRCCVRLNEQKHCLCQYMAKPEFKSFISSPNGRKVLDVCRIPFPRC